VISSLGFSTDTMNEMLAEQTRQMSALRESYGYSDWWWSEPRSLSSVATFLMAHNFCVIDNFLGGEGFQQVRREVLTAHLRGHLNVPGALGGGREGSSTKASVDETIRSDLLGWFDCSAAPSGGAAAATVDAGKPSCFFEKSAVTKTPQLEDTTAHTPNSLSASASMAMQTSNSDSQLWPEIHLLLQKMETLVAELRSFALSRATETGDNEVETSDSKAFSRICAELVNVKTRSKAMVSCYPKG
jgi:hypothetical protein